MKSQKFSDLTVNFMGKCGILTVFSSPTTGSILQFLIVIFCTGVMAEGNRLKRAKGIIGAYEKIMRARRGEVDCTVTTAKVSFNW